MPPRKSLKPTDIYWLVDMRPETIAAGWPNGKPFYCGKTVRGIEVRLKQHKSETKKSPNRKVCKIILTCGEFLQTRHMETVSEHHFWVEREIFWIKQLRLLNPDCANVKNAGGGSGERITLDQRSKQNALRPKRNHAKIAMRIGEGQKRRWAARRAAIA